METTVWVLPMPMQLRQMLKRTTSQTALTGVCVLEFTLLKKLDDFWFVSSMKRKGGDDGGVIGRRRPGGKGGITLKKAKRHPSQKHTPSEYPPTWPNNQ